MTATIYKGFSDKAILIDVDISKTIAENLEENFNLDSAIILKNGKVAKKNENIKDGDILLIRVLPFPPMAVAIVSAVVTLVSVTVSLAVSIPMMIEANEAREKANRDRERLNRLSKKIKDDSKNIPYLRGAQNQIVIGNTQPLILGRHLFTPFLMSNGLNKVNDKGELYFYMILQMGFNNQVIEKIYCDDIVLKSWNTNTHQNGTYLFNQDSFFYDETNVIEVRQDGSLFSDPNFNRSVTIKNLDKRILFKGHEDYPADHYIETLPLHAKKVEVCFTLDGFVQKKPKLPSNPNKVPPVQLPRYRLDLLLEYQLEDGGQWYPFNDPNWKLKNYTDFKKIEKTRFVAEHTFSFNEVKNLDNAVKIRIRENSMIFEGLGNEQIILNWIETERFDYDKSTSTLVSEEIIGMTERQLSTLVGIKIKVTPETQEKLTRINCITNSVSRKYENGGWSQTKAPNRNPASLLLEVLTSHTHKPSQCQESEIDLESFGELYEYCEEKNLKFDIVLTEGQTKQEVCELILDSCNAMLYKNILGKISVAIDKPKSNAVALFNSQNIISIENEKTMHRQTDGIKINYISSAGGFVESSYLVMRDGVTRTADSILREITVDGITEFDNIVAYARRILAIEKLRPKTVRVETGFEGTYYTPLSKVLLEHDSLKIGKGNAEIKSVIDNGYNVTGLELYEPIDYDENETNAIIISAIRDDKTHFFSLRFNADEKRTNIINLIDVMPLNQLVLPRNGDVLSYGLIEGEFQKITNEMLLVSGERTDDGFCFTLVDYDEAIYETGAIPEYNPSFSKNSVFSVEYPKALGLPLPPTIAELEELKESLNNVIMNVSSSLVLRNRQNILSPDFLHVEIKPMLEQQYCLFVLEATHDFVNWQVVSEPNVYDDEYDFNLSPIFTVDGESHFVVAYRVSAYDAEFIDEEYEKTKLLAQKEITVSYNPDVSAIYFGARNTEPQGNLQIGDYYFDKKPKANGGGILKIWTGSNWVVFDSNSDAYANAFNVAVTDIMIWVKENGEEDFYAVNAIFESIGANRAFISVLTANELNINGTFSGGNPVNTRAIASLKDKYGVTERVHTGTGVDNLEVVSYVATQGYVRVTILQAENGDVTRFGGVIFDTEKEYRSTSVIKQSWQEAKTEAEKVSIAEDWRLPTIAEAKKLPTGKYWTSQTTGDNAYIVANGIEKLVSKNTVINYDRLSNNAFTSQIHENKLYLISYGKIEIFDLDDMTNVVYDRLSTGADTSQIHNDKLYVINRYDKIEVFDLFGMTNTTYDRLSNDARTSQIHNDKLYVINRYDKIEVFDLFDMTNTTYDRLSNDASTSQIYDDKLYVIGQNKIEVFDLNDMTSISYDRLNVYASTSQIYDDKLYVIGQNKIEVFDLNDMTSISYDRLNVYASTSQIYDDKLYVIGQGKIEVFDLFDMTNTTYDRLSNDARTSQIHNDKLYVISFDKIEVFDTYLLNNSITAQAVRDNTETRRKRIESSSDKENWINREESLIKGNTVFTSYYNLRLSFKGENQTVGDYWTYTIEDLDALAIYDKDDNVYFRASNGVVSFLNMPQVNGADIVLVDKGFTGKITTQGSNNRIYFYDKDSNSVSPKTALNGLQVGDVIEIGGSWYYGMHTVENIYSTYIVVNYEHCSNRCNGSLKLPDNTGIATVKILAKYYNAPLGLGQAWVDVTSKRSNNSTVTNSTNRPIFFNIEVVGNQNGGAAQYTMLTDGVTVNVPAIYLSSGLTYSSYGVNNSFVFNTSYKITLGSKSTLSKILEMR